MASFTFPADWRLFYEAGPGRGSFVVGKKKPATVDCFADEPTLKVFENSGRTVDIQVVLGPVRLFGINPMRRQVKAGAVVHQLGNGFGMAHHFAAVPEASWRTFFDTTSPHLVTVLLGTNDMNNGWYPDEYEKEMDQLLTRLKAAAPSAELIILSAPSSKFDRKSFANEFSKVAKNLSARHGTRFWDLNAFIGDNWKWWDALGLMEYSLHYEPPSGLLVARQLLLHLGFNPQDPQNQVALKHPQRLLKDDVKPLEHGPEEGWPQRPDRARK